MGNQLPEKLTTLRKRYHYTQSDIAAKVSVPVAEYMKWENGSSLCRIDQLIRIAELYRVPLQALVDNTAVLDLPDPEHDYDGIEIPSFTGAVSGKGVVLDEAQAQEILFGMPSTQDSVEIPLSGDVGYRQPVQVQKASGTTKQMPAVRETPLSGTREFASTRVIQISDIKQEEPVRKDPEPEEKPRSRVLYIVIAVVLALLAGLIFLMGRGGGNDGSRLDVSDDDRFVLTERYSAYVSPHYRLVTQGTVGELSGFSDLVKISAWDDVLIGLKRDGTVVSGGDHDVSEWTDITDIAAGSTHAVGLDSEGTVVCAGSGTACDADGWENMTAVFAGKDITAAIGADGSVQAAGDSSLRGELNGLRNVKDIAFSENGAVVLYLDGTAETFGSLKDLEITADNIVSAAAGEAFAAVLDGNGHVRVYARDKDFGKEAEKWQGIRYIAARGKTLIALDGDERIIGLGDNFHNVYTKDSTEPVEKTALDQVGNAQFSVTASGLNISWDAVEHAKYYEVTVSTSPQTKLNSAGTSARISDEKLQDGVTYTVTIVPQPDDADLYEAGAPLTLTYMYKAAQVQLDAPQNVRVEQKGTTITVMWERVDKADYYNVAVETMVMSSSTNSITLDGTHLTNDKRYTVYVTALSGNSRYTESNGGTADFTYKAPVVVIRLAKPKITTLNVEENNDWTIRWEAVENAAAYSVRVGEISQQVSGTSVTIGADLLNSGTTYIVGITALPADTEKYDASEEATGSYSYTKREPEVTESPEPTEEPEPSVEPDPETPDPGTGEEDG